MQVDPEKVKKIAKELKMSEFHVRTIVEYCLSYPCYRPVTPVWQKVMKAYKEG